MDFDEQHSIQEEYANPNDASMSRTFEITMKIAEIKKTITTRKPMELCLLLQDHSIFPLLLRWYLPLLWNGTGITTHATHETRQFAYQVQGNACQVVQTKIHRICLNCDKRKWVSTIPLSPQVQYSPRSHHANHWFTPKRDSSEKGSIHKEFLGFLYISKWDWSFLEAKVG